MKIRNLLVIIFFFSSVFLSTIIINNNDKYEISSDIRSNHTLIKSDILRFWSEAHNIKKNLENGAPVYKLGGYYYSSFLPAKTIALYYILISEDLFLENEYNADGKLKVKSNNNKNLFVYLQILIFFISILTLYNVAKKRIGNVAKIILFFLLIEPTIHQFNYSFHSESIFFSLSIFLLSAVIKSSNRKSTAFLIGILVGILYLQRSIAIFYFIPIMFFFFLEKKTLRFFISYIGGIFLILSFLGTHNYLRAGVIYVTPYQSKIDLYLYFIPNILQQKDEETSQKELSLIDNKIKLFKRNKNLDLSLEKDKILYGNFIRNLSINYIIKNPIESTKVIIKKSIHSINFNPFEIYSFYKYEYRATDYNLRYYKSSEHQKFLIYRTIYSLSIYLICLLGFFTMLKKKELFNIQILLLLSILYYVVLAGWHGNPRYLSTNMIFLSIFFGFGFLRLKEITIKNIKKII